MQNRHRKKPSAAGRDKHMNMHFQFRIKRRMARTHRETRNSKTDKRRAPRRLIIKEEDDGEQKGEKDSVRGGISFSPCRPDAA